jgi:glycosyltransferase involved in cell wall biosynthesis
MKLPSVSVCIPTYNAADIILPTLESIKQQKYPNLEVIISDDNSTDDTVAMLKAYRSLPLKVYAHKQNLGYAGNLNRLLKFAKNDIVFLLGQDDLIINRSLSDSARLLSKHPQAAFVTRPYYWFFSNPSLPLRHIAPISTKTKIIELSQNPEQVINLIETIGQLSGLAFRRSLVPSFDPYVFTSHVTPLLSLAARYPYIHLHQYGIAVSTHTSQTRHVSSIYRISPLKTWINCLNISLHSHPAFNYAYSHICQNYVGFVQLKNYSTYHHLLREILLTIRFLSLIHI